MNINTITLANSNRVLLLEDVFPNDLLTLINELCSWSVADASGWNYAKWSPFRKIHNGIGRTCDNIVRYSLIFWHNYK